MRKETGSRLASNARLAWLSFGLLVIALLLVAELTRAEETPVPPDAAGGEALKVYVSLPRQGDNASTSRLIMKGLNAAVRSVNGKVGGKPVRLVQLDDARGSRCNAALGGGMRAGRLPTRMPSPMWAS